MTEKQPTHVDAPVWLVLSPDWYDRWHGLDAQDRPILKGAKVVKHTQQKPNITREGVAVKITLRVPASAFLPLQPEAIVVLRENDVETIVVTAEPPELDEPEES
jgi:hypothetical protein